MDDGGRQGRSGSRRAAPRRRTLDVRVVALGLGVVVAVVAWLLLVVAAIRFGQSARGGESSAWAFMALASLGGVACLFLALVLGWRVATAVGMRSRAPVRPVAGRGGKRSAGRRARH